MTTPPPLERETPQDSTSHFYDFYDEDGVMCECGHVGRAHGGRALHYSCYESGCSCRGFQGVAALLPPAPPETP